MFNCNINLFMNKKIITGFLMFALAVFSMSSFVACKDIDEDSYDDLKARINAVSKDQMTIRDGLQSQIDALKDAIGKIKSCTCDPSNYASAEDMRNAQRKIDELEDALNKLSKYVHDSISSGSTGSDTTIYYYYYDSIYVENPYNDSLIWVNLNKLNTDVAEQLKMINFLNGWILYVQGRHENDSARIDGLENLVLGWDSVLTNLNVNIVHVIDSLIEEKIKHDTLVVELDSAYIIKIDSARLIADSALKVAEKALDLAQWNAERISTLERYVSTLVTQGDLQAEISKLNSRINGLLDQMITGIIIQATESPVIGYLNTPFDTRAQMIAAYYGEVDHDVKFPASTSTDYVNASEVWSLRDVQVMGVNPGNIEGATTIYSGEFVSEKNGDIKGNAGTLYLTVNPANVNFTNKKLTLETSAGNESKITLEPLAKSDRELTFGYTRANNGFYETEATLKVEDIDDVKMRIDYTSLESDVKAVLKNKDKQSVLNFAAALINSVENVMPAYGVKASWQETGKVQKYDVFSQYCVAATAIKPLSYAFLKDHGYSLPFESKVHQYVDKVIDKINFNINLNLPDFSKYKGSITFTDITLPTIDDNTFRITYKHTYTAAELAGQGELWNGAPADQLYFLVTNAEGSRYALVYYDVDGKVHLMIYDNGWREATDAEFASFGAITFELTVDVDINKTPELKSLLQDIIDELNKQFGANSDIAKTLTDLMNDIAAIGDLDDKINQAISDAKGDLKNQMNGYVTRVYNKLNGWFQKYPNAVLQPIIIAKVGDKAKVLGRTKNFATKANGTLTLVPTSYTLEMLAPSYKKVLAVTNVFDATTKVELPLADAKAKAAVANQGENMLKVIDDGESYCTFSGEVGYIYEITYSAVDYHGKITNKKFYVQF